MFGPEIDLVCHELKFFFAFVLIVVKYFGKLEK
jgi:hypothetical protein